ncbi:MAG: bifunctional folylpolyglutamate synthase/dihydrofolate synthase [Roseburia sp.]|nr:bifunctional folylpolyglutamate synthase/dihydrofolate synthase [Roseburia sp.]
MNYRQAKAYIQEIQSGARIKPGLGMTTELLKRLGDPQDKLRFVHIAGTNGKGSTASFISSVLAEAGWKIGRYVSPAVCSDLETVQWIENGKIVYITEEEMAELLTEVLGAVRQMRKDGVGTPTEFEIETAMAFLAFVRWNTDLVVLETGMGGRLDSTNVVKTVECSVITPISMDHMKFLGDTLEEIAKEKAGIIKNHVPVVSCQKDERAAKVISGTCEKCGSELHTVEKERIQIRQTSLNGSVFEYGKFGKISIALPGVYQVENACLALECIDVLRKKYSVSTEQIQKGMVKTVWRGRFEVLRNDPVVVVDGAHNTDGMQSFLQSVQRYFKTGKKTGIMGVFADKDYKAMSVLLAGIFDTVYTVTPKSERGLPAEKLADELAACQIHAVACSSFQEAAEYAMKDGGQEKKCPVFVFGSLSLIKEAYREFRLKNSP